MDHSNPVKIAKVDLHPASCAAVIAIPENIHDETQIACIYDRITEFLQGSPVELYVALRLQKTGGIKTNIIYSAATKRSFKTRLYVLVEGVSVSPIEIGSIDTVFGATNVDEVTAVRSSRGLDPVSHVKLTEKCSETPVPVFKPTPQEAFHKFVALGGTFDRLHGGHKLLLSAAALLCTHKLTIGITSMSMLSKKKHSSLIQPFHTRAMAVANFLRLLKPSLEIYIEELTDPVGPAGTDDSLTALVVTPDTMTGAAMVNEQRVGRGLDPLKIVTIDFVEGYAQHIPVISYSVIRGEDKISSTWLREQDLHRSESQ